MIDPESNPWILNRVQDDERNDWIPDQARYDENAGYQIKFGMTSKIKTSGTSGYSGAPGY
jgi:hypothetical protein